MITLQDVSLYRGSKCLLEEASLRLPQRCICGLIGQNGVGKSSLFSLLQGRLELDHGEYHLPSSARLASMAQELPDSKASLLEYTCHGDKEWSTIQEQLVQADDDDDGMITAEAYARLEEIDGYSIESRAATILVGLGFSQTQLNHSLDTFSGGWQMRAQLARVLISRAELLLLDEPTNHLDLESVVFLQDWLTTYKGCAVVISHEREFLDTVASHIIHQSQQRLTLYTGNYTEFSRQLSEAMALESKMQKKIEDKRAHMQSFVDRFRAKASKAKQAQGRIKALEKLQFSPTFTREQSFSFEFLESPQISNPALSVEADLGYEGQAVLKNIKLSISNEDRIGVIGVNGAGKSTFLKSIAKQLPLVSGNVQWHPKMSIGYYSQHQLDLLDLDATPLQMFYRQFGDANEKTAIQHLARFNFSYEKCRQLIQLFSGGERARLALALLVWHRPNLLILDEPTNHLDIQMREALITAIQTFEGSVLLVSHDRYLLECVVDQFLIVKEGQVKTFAGTLEQYTQQVREETKAKTKEPKKSDPVKNTKVPSIDKQLEKLEQTIANLEKELSSLDQQLADPALYDPASKTDKIKALQDKRNDVSAKLDSDKDRWLDLI